jgi:hypothetical protein
MLVSFRVQAIFTDAVKYSFARKVREAQDPFRELSAVGGKERWFFSGILDMRPLKQKKRIAYEITAALVKKVEDLTLVGVERVDFELIDPEVL